jgi:hypothetical protein
LAQQIHFFMAPEDERELFRKLEQWDLDLWPEYGDPGHEAAKVGAAAADALGDEQGWYFAVEPPTGFPIKRGEKKGLWKVDEVKSAVVYFCRSQLDEDGELRSGYFWVELETAGDYSARGGKPDKLRRLFNELAGFLKVRYRKSKPVGHFVGPHAARLFNAGTVLREAGRKGEVVEPYR